MSLNALWHTIQAGIASFGAWLAAFVSGLDGLVSALLVFVVADFIAGVLAAITARRLSSAVGFLGITRKILIFPLVGLAHLIDTQVIRTPSMLRAAVIFFSLPNEGISLIENAPRLGLPIPAQMRDALDAIANRADKRPPLTNTDPTETHTDKEQR